MSDPLVHLRDLEKAYYLLEEEILVLKKINLDIHKGEFMAIMGTSGSGKSTLMNIVGFLDRPTRGTYELKGKDVSALTDDDEAHIRNREIGFVYQNFNLLPRCTAYENVAMPLLIRREPRSAAFEKARALLDRVGLGERLSHKPGELSGGERQRAAVARALITRPQLVLADEPTGNLDAGNGEHVLRLMLELNEELNTSLVIVTHDHSIADRMNRVLVLEDGRLHAQ